MTAFEVLDQGGQKVAERELPAELFEAPVSVQLMHQVVVAGMASLRRGTHSTKGRGEVSGGGRKPWRQKGTGRARQGSNRAPQWTGGGVVHGPQPRSHAMRVNKKMKKGALRSALTDALQSGKLVLVDDLRFDEPKTKRAAEVMDRHAGPKDRVALDAAFGTWIHPAFGVELSRPVDFIPPGDGPPLIVDDARWVVIDRGWNILWQHPEFRDLSQARSFLVRGKPSAADTRVLRYLRADSRFQLVFYNPAWNQAVFQRIR